MPVSKEVHAASQTRMYLEIVAENGPDNIAKVISKPELETFLLSAANNFPSIMISILHEALRQGRIAEKRIVNEKKMAEKQAEMDKAEEKREIEKAKAEKAEEEKRKRCRADENQLGPIKKPNAQQFLAKDKSGMERRYQIADSEVSEYDWGVLRDSLTICIFRILRPVANSQPGLRRKLSKTSVV